MPLQIRCTQCQVSIKVADTLRGKSIRCPSCQQVTKVPGGQTRVTGGNEFMEQGPPRAPRANPRNTRVGAGTERERTRLQRHEPEDDDRASSRPRRDEAPRRHRQAGSRSAGFWVATTAVVLVLMAGAAAGTYWLARPAIEPQAAAPKSSDDSEAAKKIARLKKENDALKRIADEAARKAAENDATKPPVLDPKKTDDPRNPPLETKKPKADKTPEEIAQAKKAADEKKAMEDSMAKTPDELAAKKKMDEDLLAKKKMDEDLLAKKKMEDDLLAKTKADDDVLAKKKADDDVLAKKKADDDVLAKKKADDDVLAKKKADDDVLAKKKADDDLLAKKTVDEQKKAPDAPKVTYQPVPIPPGPAPDKIAVETTRKVKKATAFIRVMDSSGGGTGSGFFAMEPGIVITNAHVVGMKSPSAGAPKKLEIVIHSGTKDEKSFDAVVLGVDRDNDLAVVKLKDADVSQLPAPLPVELDGCSLEELQDLYVFGFPHGEQLGKEITIRPSSVSSFRRDVDGSLFQIQVNGGMDPGNSGGPVVDTRGVVVGVSVSGIRGTTINFAVPSEKIQGMIYGRVQETLIGMAFRDQQRVKLPVKLTCLDPLERVSHLSVDVWTGPGGATRPGSLTQPADLPGDGARRNFALKYQLGKAQHDVDLPSLDLPAGHVVWIQPVLVSSSGVKQWAPTTSLKPQDLSPLERIPANLTFRTANSERNLDLHGRFAMEITNGKEKITFSDDVKFQVLEEMTKAPNGAALRIAMGKGEFSETVPDKETRKPITNPRNAAAQAMVKRKIFQFATDPNGRLERFSFPQFGLLLPALDLDPSPVQNLSKKGKIGGPNPKQPKQPRQPPPIMIPGQQPVKVDAEDMASMFNATYQLASISVPNRSVQPLEVWDAKIAMLLSQGRTEKITLDLNMTFIYEGSRTVNGKTEALVTITGELEKRAKGKDKDVGRQSKSRIRGQGSFDTATGFFSKLKVSVLSEGELSVLTKDGPVEIPFVRIFEVTLTRVAGNGYNIGPLPPRAPPANVATEVQGIWNLVSCKWNGVDDMNKFGNVLTVNNSSYTLVKATGPENGTIILTTTKNPKEMVLQKGNSHIGAIYNLQGDTLTICFALGGPTPTAFTPQGNALLVYKRVGMPAANPGPNPGPNPKNTGALVANAPAQPPAPADVPGKVTVDLIPFVNTAQPVNGKWAVGDNALHCTSKGLRPRAQINYVPPQEYDYVVVFSQPALRNGISLLFPNPHGGSCIWTVSSSNGKDGSLHLNGRAVNKPLPSAIQPNTIHTTVVKVRKDGVTIFLDGVQILDHKTDYRDLVQNDNWFKMPNPNQLGISCDDPTVFHYVRVVEITGAGVKIGQPNNPGPGANVGPSNGPGTGASKNASAPKNVDLGGADGATRILGGAFDPQFMDEAPAGGILIGFEFGLGKFVNNDNIKAIRPIYRTAQDDEVKGKQYGTKLERVVTVKAKAGYAVGSVRVNAGLWIDGATVTFMRVANGKLDPADSYQADCVGSAGNNETLLGGDGTPVVGVIGKSNQSDCGGIGLLMRKTGGAGATTAQPNNPGPGGNAGIDASKNTPSPAQTGGQTGKTSGREFTPKNGMYTITLPDGDNSTLRERTKILTVNNRKCPVEESTITKDGVHYLGGSIGIPAVLMREIPAAKRFDVLSDAILKSMNGKIKQQKDIKLDPVPGKEYLVDLPNGVARLQMYTIAGWVVVAIVEGKTAADVNSRDADAFFNSLKLTAEAKKVFNEVQR